MNQNYWKPTQATRLAVLAMALVLAFAVTGTAHAQADLQITAMSVQGPARVGTCNTVMMTVKNTGDAFTGNATLDIALITFPSNTPNQNRVTQSLFISPLQGGGQSSFPINNVEFKVPGSATIQGVADSTNETQESNEDNNSRTATTNVSGTCYTPPPPPPPANQGCDVEATFITPSGNSVPGNQSYTYEVRFTNKGSAACDPFKVKMVRYNSTHCGGYGSQIGGSGNWKSIGSLAPNASQTASFGERKTPGKGGACLNLGYSPSNYSDANNGNHRPKKVISYQ